MPPFNLPPSWNPGYALPTYAEAEGLERRAFATEWAPRGTYDMPPVGTGGYAVPRYIKEEGYGQGAHVTKWMPRGEYGPGIPDYLSQPKTALLSAGRDGAARQYSIEVLSGDQPAAAADPFAAYGRRAAHLLLTQVRRVPAAQRKFALKLVLDTLDPSLWAAAAAAGEKLRAQGADPQIALEAGLAASMARGILDEVVQVGERRTAPEASSQLGLGCYGCGVALGDVVEALGEAMPQLILQAATVTTGSTRDRRGQTSTTNVPRPPPAPAPNTEKIQIGPFAFGVSGPQRFSDHRDAIASDWKTYFAGEAKRLTAVAQSALPNHLRTSRPAKEFGLDKWLGMSPNTPINTQFVTGRQPLVKAKHPKLGTDYGLFLESTPNTFTVWWKPVVDRSLWGHIKALAATIVSGAEAVYEFAKDTLSDLGALACKLVNNGVAPLAASAGAAAAGAPPQAGAVGVDVARGVCQQEPKVDVPIVAPPPPGGVGIGTIALVAAALGGAYFLTTRRGH